MKRVFACMALILGLALAALPCAAEAAGQKVRLTFGQKTAVVELNGNTASRDFASLLPLTLKLEDYNNTEKISYLPRKLQTKGSPNSCDPVRGMFTYYAPWGNLAIFVRDFRHSNGLVPMGTVISGMDDLAGAPDGVSVVMEAID